MKYLKKLYTDGTCRFIPLDGSTFEFIHLGNDKYEIAIISNGQTFLIDESKRIYGSLNDIIKNIMEVEDGSIVSLSDLLSLG
jgi:hypothetical protein